MSGTVVNVIGGLERFASILFGGAPPMVLGPVVFQGLEVPEKAPWGGKQMLTIHKLVGGQRVIDAMGRDDMDIAWSGILEGPSATQRAQQIDSVRTRGAQVQLTWDTLSWTVVVESFTADYKLRNWIPYTLKCVVVKDNSANFSSPSPTTQQATTQAVSSASSVTLPTMSAVNTALSGVTSALNLPEAFSVGSGDFTAALASLSGAQSTISNAVNMADGQLSGIISGFSGQLSGVLGPISGSLTSVVNAAAGGIGGDALTSLTGGLSTELSSLTGQIGDQLTTITNTVIPEFSSALSTVNGQVGGVLGQLSDALTTGGSSLTTIFNNISPNISAVVSSAGGISGDLPGILGTLNPQVAIGNLSAIQTAAGNLAGTLQQSGFVNTAMLSMQNLAGNLQNFTPPFSGNF